MWPATMRQPLAGGHPSVSSSTKGGQSVNRVLGVVAIGIVALAAGVGCSHGDKAGGSGGTLTLRLASDDPPETAASQQIMEFARQARRLSDGRLRIHVEWEANGAGPRHPRASDQKTAKKVITGKYELALVPARAWDVFGVKSLQAIQAPFLVNSDALLDKVTSGPIAGQMLAGLSDVGVVGLALLPEALRHPVGFSDPLRAPSDFVGIGIRAPRSKLTWEILRALGAEPVDLVGNEIGPAIDSGRLRGAESEIGLVRNLARPGTLTANITFFPKANTLVANQKAFERLTDDQRKTLRRAAAETLEQVRASRSTDAEAARTACSARVRIVLASDADVRALVRKTQPVIARLEQDGATKRLMQRIKVVRETVLDSSPAVAPCGRPRPGTTSATSGGGPPTLPPDGVYRALLSPKDFLREGIDAAEARNNSGLWTLTLNGGRVSWHSKEDPYTECVGQYFLSKGAVRFVMDSPSPCGAGPGNWIFSARWKREDGGIRFTSVLGSEPPFEQVAWGSKVWRRIGAP
jgi:TRAP-type C4-dicarboxylate transport system substrate-binding protein